MMLYQELFNLADTLDDLLDNIDELLLVTITIVVYFGNKFQVKLPMSPWSSA